MSDNTVVPVDVYVRVQQFYSRQMALLDDGKVDLWITTFCEDAVFAETGMAMPLRGRESIRETVQSGVDRLAASATDFRHWFGMLDVRTSPDGVHTRFSTLALATPPGGEITLHGNVIGQDNLIPDGESWLVRYRHLRYDGTG